MESFIGERTTPSYNILITKLCFRFSLLFIYLWGGSLSTGKKRKKLFPFNQTKMEKGPFSMRMIVFLHPFATRIRSEIMIIEKINSFEGPPLLIFRTTIAINQADFPRLEQNFEPFSTISGANLNPPSSSHSSFFFAF